MNKDAKKLDEKALMRAIEQAKDEVEKQEYEEYIDNRPVFILCQYLKAVVPDGKDTVQMLKQWVKLWYDSLNFILEGNLGQPMSFTEVWSQFIEIWEGKKAKHSKGESLELAIKKATERKETRPELDRYNDDKKVQLLGHTCYELQELRGDNQFFLSGEDAGRIIGRSQRTGRLILKMFCTDGVLKLLAEGNRHNAAFYQYIC